MTAQIKKRSYWLKVFLAYAAVEACIQLLLWLVLNHFGGSPISILEFHVVMWVFQCLLAWPIWLVAWKATRYPVLAQVIINLAFYVVYSFAWFGPVQDGIAFCFDQLQQLTRAPGNRITPYVDRADQYWILNYQLLKHGFRLGWFFLALYFYHYLLAEKKRMQLALANKELQLDAFKWRLNPGFYLNTISYLQRIARQKPRLASQPILKLADVMEYVIYEAKEKEVWLLREVHFLQQYLQLLNGQHGSTIFTLEVQGKPGEQKMQPLLLTGLVDKVCLVNDQNSEWRISLSFSAEELTAEFTGQFNNMPDLGFEQAFSTPERTPTGIAVKIKLHAPQRS
ncbi:sensor histidine kinase [Chitinophaga alhagiae]|uniref:sensor histidine kinase n=1 Tax=Chitinophaga alhagiae TaxID=2203219 RepID=UPI001300B20E|nr:histidine kinase [Chitinophaga alhagiae]